MQIYVIIGTAECGPLTVDEVKEMILYGTVNNSTLIWFEGLSEWSPLEKFLLFFNNADAPIISEGQDQTNIENNSHCENAKSNYSSSLGLKWLKFWNYFSLPTGSFLGLLSILSVSPPITPVVFWDVGILILQFSLIYGLHQRRLWAWKLNWIIVITIFINVVTKVPVMIINKSDNILIMQFLIRLTIGVLWLWSNYVYWNKRQGLFK
jgi:hypothetical protein